MDLTAIIKEIGGGLPAVVIAVLSLAVWHLWRRGNEQTDRALDREREHSAELVETIRTIDRYDRAQEGGQ
ncbi:hypothetical protein MACH17_11550 [Phaeobacter inhibens]|uniref:hypothetical protein n=1 Tax=Phaeobacter inhibens TaxID=221822 RepID=UPI00274E44EF|nr:hypothetical protein [Phaeobacter inhibens]GLO69638.1 hypothetical protein MACH17_11550 [Phaeobacter inhibens]